MTSSGVDDAVGEWWIQPLAVYDEGRNRTVGGAISADRGDGRAEIVVWELDHETGVTRRHAVGCAPADDHNVPSTSLLPDGRILLAWTHHNLDSIQRFKLSGVDGDLAAMADVPIVQRDSGFPVSYSQAFVLPQSMDNGTIEVWQLARYYRGDGWAWEWLRLTVHAVDGSIEFGNNIRFLSGGTQQIYVSTAFDAADHRVRVVCGHNPANDLHALYAFEVDLDSHRVTSLSDNAMAADLGSEGLPIRIDEHAPLLADPGPNRARRFFYPRPGPAPWAVAYAEWDIGQEELGRYVLCEPHAWGETTHDLGPTGPRMGYTARANYVGGVGFSGATFNSVLVARRTEDGRRSSVEEMGTTEGVWETRLVDESRGYLARPSVPFGGGPLSSVHSEFAQYSDSYTDYRGGLRLSERRPR